MGGAIAKHRLNTLHLSTGIKNHTRTHKTKPIDEVYSPHSLRYPQVSKTIPILGEMTHSFHHTIDRCVLKSYPHTDDLHL